ncbi:MAG: hypothetical protein IJY61_04080 [Candidatus Gastranaerophilales bacterium]|nr:hypothetical protein [Candidatus Gastranaerophilales bacterium]
MNFYDLKLKFKEFLIDQGISSTKISQEKDLDNINLFTFGNEFQKFIDEEYEINLENEYTELAELFDTEMQDGKFVLDENQENDKEANFMVDMVNGLLEDEEFVENIDEYAANDNQENSMLDMLSDLFKEKGITQDNSSTQEAEELADSANASMNNNGAQNTNNSTAPTSNTPTSAAPTNNSSRTPNNIFTPPTETTKDYSEMTRKELEEAKSSQQSKINEESQNLDNTISQNQDDIAKAKEEYDAAMDEDNIDPALLESRNQNLEAITQTDNTINELTSTISDLDTQISSVDSEISSVDSSISALNSALSSLSAPADDEEAQKAVATKKAEISAQIAELNAQKNDLTAQKTDLESQKTENETSLTENTRLLQQLETEKSNIENQILQTCNENTKAALENYNQVRNDAQTALQSAKDTLNSVQKELSEIDTHLNKAKSKELEDKYSQKDKANTFDINEGFEAIKGEGDTNMSYSVIKPKNLDPNEEVPVIVYLHGAGGNEHSLYTQIMDDYNLPEGFNGYIICPTAQGYWDNERSAENIDQILTTFGETHNIDANNITIVGHSMGGTGALYMADSEVFKDDEGYKFSKAAAITGYSKNQNDYDIPVALYADSTSEYALKDHNLNADSDDMYVDWVGEAHTNMDNRAFTEDADNDGKADLLEWLFDED